MTTTLKNRKSGSLKLCESSPELCYFQKNSDLKRQNSTIALFPSKFNLKQNYANISDQQLAELLYDGVGSNETITVLDARFDYEFRAGHIIGALNPRNKGQLEKIVNRNATQNTFYAVYCDKSTNRSQMIVSRLSQLVAKIESTVTTKFYVLDGGFESFSNSFPNLITGYYTGKADPKFVKSGIFKKCTVLFRKEFNRQSAVIFAERKIMRRRSCYEAEDAISVIAI